ncbi:GGDEF domain-containing protein [Nitratireductor luteus]|uniref:GGDEF domain-containing protein n=1 Tax=Nitratireductor luteus TaxID=2976980 RepID=UPI00223FEA02|nr:GGDEF domain-containing protein [Nitratireductor luteus]
MRKVFVYASISTAISILGSLAVGWLALTMLGRDMDSTAFAICTLCPTAIVFPASAYTYNQRRKVAEVHNRLRAAHRELAAMNRRLAEKALVDSLTGLLNRGVFIEVVERSKNVRKRGSLLVADADNFKQINDRFGHLTGDDALRKIARAIADCTRRADYRGRLGGEEFGVFLVDADLGEASKVAERIRKAVEEAGFVAPDGTPVQLTVSIGVATAETGASFADLMNVADKRLYEAKAKGRNMVILPPQTPVAA